MSYDVQFLCFRISVELRCCSLPGIVLLYRGLLTIWHDLSETFYLNAALGIFRDMHIRLLTRVMINSSPEPLTAYGRDYQSAIKSTGVKKAIALGHWPLCDNSCFPHVPSPQDGKQTLWIILQDSWSNFRGPVWLVISDDNDIDLNIHPVVTHDTE
jgi:hypothetical protein